MPELNSSTMGGCRGFLGLASIGTSGRAALGRVGLWLLVWGGVIGAACGTPAPDLSECIADSDCSSGRPYCEGGRCVECTRTRDTCEVGPCVGGRCPQCVDASSCGGMPCLDGFCAPCESDEQCGPSEAGSSLRWRACVGGFCGHTCADMDDPVGYCLSYGVEEGEARGCRYFAIAYASLDSWCDGTDLQVDVSPICDPCRESVGGCGLCTIDGECRCSVDDDCVDGQVCDGGYCSDCVESTRCHRGRVRRSCASDAECGGLRCIRGRCTPCESDTDCPCDHHCSVGRCVESCVGDEQCPVLERRKRGVLVDIPTFCELESGRCRLCRGDDDCVAPARCYADGCVVPCPEAGCGSGAIPTACTSSGRCSGCESHALVEGPMSPPTSCERRDSP